MFAKKLASIEELEKSEQEVFESVGPSNAIEKSELIVNPVDGLFDLFLYLTSTSFVDNPQFSELSLGWMLWFGNVKQH